MLTAQIIAVALTGLCVFAGGCAGTEPSHASEETTDPGQEHPEQEIIVMNGDDPLFFWKDSTQAALRSLAEAPLGSSVGELVETPLLADAEGRRLLGYVVTCALSEGEELHSTTAGVSFEGVVGIASKWASAPLDKVASQRWVTACLLQTLNGLGMKVPIRMSGSHPAIAAGSETETSDYSVPESTMFGNIFGPADAATFACLDAKIDLCDISWSSHALERICGLSPTCGIVSLGPCDLSCDRDAAGHPACHGGLAGGLYAEAISSSLQKSGFISLFGDCGY